MKNGKIQVIIAGSGRGLYLADIISGYEDIKQEAEVLAIVDIKTENHGKLREAMDSKALKDAVICTTLDEALEKFPESDCVFVVTPNTTHAELAEKTLNAGKHLFLEKPVAADWADAERIRRAAQAHPEQTIQLGFMLRYSSFFRKIVDTVHSGALGRVVMVRANERLSFAHSNAYRRGWRRRAAVTGGIMNEKCSHDIDVMNWIMSKQAKPADVFSIGGNELFAEAPAGTTQKCADCPDEKCVFRFNAEKNLSGRYTMARDSNYFENCTYRTDADVMTNQSIIIRYDDNTQGIFTIMGYAGAGEERDIMIHGTNGRITGDLTTGKITIELFREQTVEEFEFQGGMHGDGDSLIVKDFFRCIREKCQPAATVYDGVLASQLAFAANRSAVEHQVIKL